MPKFQVALIGLNNLFGRVSSILLKQSPLIKCVKLYDVSNINTALDVSSVNTQCRVKAFLGEEQLENALLDTDIIVIGDELPENKSTDENYLHNLATKYSDYAKAIANASPNAVVVVATNPVNSSLPLLSQLLANQGCYNCDKVMGATAVDTVRANAILASYLKLDPKDVVLPVIGGSSEQTRVPIFSQARPYFNLDQDSKNRLSEGIKKGDREVRLLKGTPETLNKCFATMKFLHSIMRGLQGEKNITDITMSKTDLVPGVEYFSLPVIFGKGGIAHRFGIPKVTDIEQTLVNGSIVNMKKEADRAALIIKGGDPELYECEFLSDEDKASKQKELFDLFVTTLNEVEEEFNITFKPNRKADLTDVFKKRPSSKKSKKAKNSKPIKTPMSALFPLKKNNKKKLTENKISEGIQKKLKPHLNSNSIVLCEPLACPERPTTSERTVEEHAEESIDEEPEEKIKQESCTQKPVEKGVTNLLYSHNCSFVHLKPWESRKKKEKKTEEKKEPDSNVQATAAGKVEEAKEPRTQRSQTARLPTPEVNPTAVITGKKHQKKAVLKQKEAEKIDKIDYYIEKLKQNEKNTEVPKQLGEMAMPSDVKNSSVLYNYCGNQNNPHSIKSESATRREKPEKKPRPDESAKSELTARMFQTYGQPLKTKRDFKQYKPVRPRKRRSEKENKSFPESEVPIVKKDYQMATKRVEADEKTEAMKKDKLQETKLEKSDESKETKNEPKKGEQIQAENKQFPNEEEIVHLNYSEPGLFRPTKRDVLNSVSVSRYMQGKLNPEKNKRLVTRRKYVLSADPVKQNKGHLNNKLSQTKERQKKANEKILSEKTKENHLKSSVATGPPKDNGEGTEVQQEQSTDSDKVKEVPEHSTANPLDIKVDVNTKAEKKEIAIAIHEEMATPAKETKEKMTDAQEKKSDRTENHNFLEGERKNTVQSEGQKEFEEYDKKRLSVENPKPIRLQTLKAFNETVSQVMKTANSAPKDSKMKKRGVFSYMNDGAWTKSQLKKKRQEETVENKQPPALVIPRKQNTLLEISRFKKKEKNSISSEKIRWQTKNADFFSVQKMARTIAKNPSSPYYSMKLTGKIEHEVSKTLEGPENLEKVISKAKSKSNKMTLQKKPCLPAVKSQIKKSSQNGLGFTPKQPHLKGSASLMQTLDKVLNSPMYKPLRKIDTLTENKKKMEKSRLGAKRSRSVPSIRKPTETTTPRSQKLTLTLKAKTNESVDSLNNDILSTIEFMRYWKKKEKDENCRQYPCPVPVIQTYNKVPHSEMEENVVETKPTSTSTVSPTEVLTNSDRPRILASGGTCADFIRAKQDKTPMEFTSSDSYAKDGHKGWASESDSSIINRLCLAHLGRVDKRDNEYSTTHIPSLKQTEEKYFLEERYE